MQLNLDLMLTADRMIQAPASAVWDVLVDVDTWPLWGPSLTGARLDAREEGLRLGSTGHVQTLLGVSLPFVITEFDPGRYWAWSVAGIPATKHRVSRVDDRTRVSILVPWWAAPYSGICVIAMRRIERLVVER